MLSLIVSKSKNNVIGNKNGLLWNFPDDMQRFRSVTEGHVIIMGRKTYESIGRLLPSRKHVVFTNNPDFKVDDTSVEVVHSVEDVQKYVEDEDENVVIGGAMIYGLLLPYVNKLYITDIDRDYEGNAIFPKIYDLKENWNLVENEEKVDSSSNIKYKFLTYERKK